MREPARRRNRAQPIGQAATRLEALAPDRQTQAGAGQGLHFPPGLSGKGNDKGKIEALVKTARRR